MTDWLELCRRAAAGVHAALDRATDRTATAGRGEGGDISLAIDLAAEDAVFEQLDAAGVPLTAVSEERGEVPIHGGGPTHVVIDPIDGSRNAKRGLPAYALSIAVASGPTMGQVELGYVRDLARDEEWWARRGGGALASGGALAPPDPATGLDLVGIESSHPGLFAEHGAALAATGAERLRAVGSVAISLCWVATGRLDGMVTLAPTRSVDSAAGQLIVREARGAVAFTDAEDGGLAVGLDLSMRSRLVAVSDPAQLPRLAAAVTG